MNIQILQEVIEETTKRYYDNEELRTKRKKALATLKAGKPLEDLSDLDDPGRIAFRLQGNHKFEAFTKGITELESITEAPEFDYAVLERFIDKNDLVDVAFLYDGARVSHAIGRVLVRRENGSLAGYGTGFLVSPRLFLTNHHVLWNEQVAENSLIQFDYYEIAPGHISQSVDFACVTNDFFMTDKRLDFTLVALQPVNTQGRQLAEFGWCPLIGISGKAIIGERVNIIQHPGGEPKQLAIRQNQIIDTPGDFLQYAADTDKGSSGGFVGNDDWQVAALHHSGVPAKDDDGRILMVDDRPWDHSPDTEHLIKWIANEGVRISSIVGHVSARFDDLTAPKRQLFEQTLTTPPVGIQPELSSIKSSGPLPVGEPTVDTLITRRPSAGAANFILNLPSELTIRLQQSVRGYMTPIDRNGADDGFGLLEEKAVMPFHDPDYSTRKGYDDNFLGVTIPIPIVTDSRIAAPTLAGGEVLHYHHFSLVMHKERKMPLFTAANVDARPSRKKPEAGKNYSRKALAKMGKNDREMWFTDPRMDERFQLSDKFYNKDRKAFDKGHVVRRDDVTWGETYKEVQLSNGDTFHITNCSPQVLGFNRSAEGVDNWGDLENFILKQAKAEKLNVFGGPVFKESDEEFSGVDTEGPVRVKIPTLYWKVVVAESNGQLQSFAFVLEQDLSKVEFEFSVTPTWQDKMLAVSELEDILVGFRFPDVVRDADQTETQFGSELRKEFSMIKFEK